MNPTVSIVIPTYNRSNSIRAAVESVLRQTWTDFELLVVDDCSTDSTVAEIKAITDPRIRWMSTQQNMGPSGARNVGIQAATGDWVAFQDSDDEWLPEKLDLQMQLLLAPGANHIAAYCGMVAVGSAENTTQTQRTQTCYIPDSSKTGVDGNILPTSLTSSLVSTQTLIARRDILGLIGGFDENLPALVDWECVLRLAQHGTFAFVDTPLVIQYFSSNSVTRERWRRAQARRRIVEKHHDLMVEIPGVLTRHYRSIAGEERRLGQYKNARQAIAMARKFSPFNLRLWLITIAMIGWRDHGNQV